MEPEAPEAGVPTGRGVCMAGQRPSRLSSPACKAGCETPYPGVALGFAEAHPARTLGRSATSTRGAERLSSGAQSSPLRILLVFFEGWFDYPSIELSSPSPTGCEKRVRSNSVAAKAWTPTPPTSTFYVPVPPPRATASPSKLSIVNRTRALRG